MIDDLIKNYVFTSKDRFLEYVTIDTQSDPLSTNFPSTEKQKDLGRKLVRELQEMGITDAELDQFGYVYATVPGSNHSEDSPVVCFCAHMDTSPDCSGANVKPIIHRHYQGQDLILPDDPTIVIKASEHPELIKKIGQDIITASGTTLLGADNKAGIAAIMDAVHFWVKHPEISRPKIRILFTPDEEVGRGVEHVDLGKLGADFAYTVDGESLGSVENETFSADALEVIFYGVSAHPGFAKGKLTSALKAAAHFVELLPQETLSPENTEGKQGFIHPVSINGTIEKTHISFILRSFESAELDTFNRLIHSLCEKTILKFPSCSFKIQRKEQYRNMKEVLDKYPKVVEFAVEAVRRCGLTPVLRSIRGGTDGSRLSFMGLPCPNIFAGEHAFHSKQEWVSVQDIQKSTETIIRLANLWANVNKYESMFI